jgi:hypothetical protein
MCINITKDSYRDGLYHDIKTLKQYKLIFFPDVNSYFHLLTHLLLFNSCEPPDVTMRRRHTYRGIKRKDGINLRLATVPERFCCRMEVAGADPSLINLHQGGSQSARIILELPEVPLLDRIFGKQIAGLRVVK